MDNYIRISTLEYLLFEKGIELRDEGKSDKLSEVSKQLATQPETEEKKE